MGSLRSPENKDLSHTIINTSNKCERKGQYVVELLHTQGNYFSSSDVTDLNTVRPLIS